MLDAVSANDSATRRRCPWSGTRSPRWRAGGSGHSTRRAIFAAFLANLGIAIVEVRRVRRSPARRRCWRSRSTRSPTPATRACCSSAARADAARRRAAPVRLRRRALLLGVRRRARAVLARLAVRALRGRREAASTRTSSSRRSWRSSCSASRSCSRAFSLRTARPRGARRRAAAVVVAVHPRARRAPSSRSCCSRTSARSSASLFALVGIALAEHHRRARGATRIGSIAIGLLLGVIAIVLAIEMKSLLIGEAGAPRASTPRSATAIESTGPRSGASSTCARCTSDPTSCSSRPRSTSTRRDIADARRRDRRDRGARSAPRCRRRPHLHRARPSTGPTRPITADRSHTGVCPACRGGPRQLLPHDDDSRHRHRRDRHQGCAGRRGDGNARGRPVPHPDATRGGRPTTSRQVVGRDRRPLRHGGPIGCTFPAVVQHGVALTAANVDKSWIGTDAEALFEGEVKRPFVVVNDADAAGDRGDRARRGTGRNGHRSS